MGGRGCTHQFVRGEHRFVALIAAVHPVPSLQIVLSVHRVFASSLVVVLHETLLSFFSFRHCQIEPGVSVRPLMGSVLMVDQRMRSLIIVARLLRRMAGPLVRNREILLHVDLFTGCLVGSLPNKCLRLLDFFLLNFADVNFIIC